MKKTFLAILFFALLPATGHTADMAIEWEVLGRFRVITNDTDRDRFTTEIPRYIARAGCRRFGAEGINLHCPIYTEPARWDYQTAWRASKAQYDIDWVHDPTRRIAVSVAMLANQTKATCRWTIDGTVATATACREVELQTTLGQHRVEVEVVSSGRLVGSGAHTIEIRDLLVVSLGDSYASGEGNPHVLVQRDGRFRTTAPAIWWDQRCHRSLHAGPSLAAHKIAAERKDSSVTFLSYACSGGEIDEGILAPYYGRETAWQVRESYRRANEFGAPSIPPAYEPYDPIALPTQMDAAVEAMCPPGKFDGATTRCTVAPRRPDYVVITTGGNEVGFGAIVSEFAFKCDAACRNRANKAVADNLRILEGQYHLLDEALRRRLQPAAVVAAGYPDPTHDQNGEFCDDRDWKSLWQPSFIPRGLNLFAGITKVSAEFAYRNVLLPLNAALGKKAQAFGWGFVAVDGVSRRKGYCSDRRWFYTFQNATIRQDNIVPTEFDWPYDETNKRRAMSAFPPGAMHPNIFGHNAYAEGISTWILQDIGKQARTASVTGAAGTIAQ